MRLRAPAVLALALTLALPSAVLAQGRDVYLLPVPAADMLGSMMGRAQPGVSASSPIGYGPRAGDVFAGFGYQAKAPGTGASDGSFSVGAGFLNPNRVMGLEVVLTSLSTIRGGFGQRVAMAAKAHTSFAGWGLGVGLSNVQLNGETDADPSVYAAATRAFRIRSGPYLNAGSINIGVGNGVFRFADAQLKDEETVGVFLSSSLRLNSWSSAIIDFNSGATTLALSFAPMKNVPLIITPAINDLSGEFGEKARLSVGAGMSWKY